MTGTHRGLFGASLLGAPPALGLAPEGTAPVGTAGIPRSLPPAAHRKVGRFEVSFLQDGYFSLPHGIGPISLEGVARGLMPLRFAFINDQPIAEAERTFHWPQRPHPIGHSGPMELVL